MLSTVMGPAYKTPSKATKSVSFRYTAPVELSSLFEDFRCMCNDAIRIAVEEKPTGRFELNRLA